MAALVVGPASGWLIGAVVLSLLTVLVTVTGNIPLNNRLAAVGDPEAAADLAAVRAWFEVAWVRWNTVRTVTSVAAFGALVGQFAAGYGAV